MIIALIAIGLIVLITNALRLLTIKYYRDIRDVQDFKTERGRMIMRECNNRIELLRVETWIGKLKSILKK